ncbi:MAG: hypothetical protein ACR2FQ_02130 [Pseudonocardiaceae bacterium]
MTATAVAPPVAPRVPAVRRVLLALAVAAFPVLQVTGMFLHAPLGETGAEQLAIVAQDPGRWFVQHVISASAGALLILAAPALAGLVRARGSALATTGAVLAVVGGAALTIAFGAEAHLLSQAADPSLDPAAMAALADLEPTSPVMLLIMAGLPLVGIGQLLLVAGLLRSRTVPWWAPTLVLVGLVGSFASAPGSLLGPVLLLPAVAGYLALAVLVARG